VSVDRYTMRWCEPTASVAVMLEITMSSALVSRFVMQTVFSTPGARAIGPIEVSAVLGERSPPPAPTSVSDDACPPDDPHPTAPHKINHPERNPAIRFPPRLFSSSPSSLLRMT
jgi:hypothetical protein